MITPGAVSNAEIRVAMLLIFDSIRSYSIKQFRRLNGLPKRSAVRLLLYVKYLFNSPWLASQAVRSGSPDREAPLKNPEEAEPPKDSTMPLDLIPIHRKRLFIERPSMPEPGTRPSPVVRVIDITRSHRIQMRILYPLPKHLLAPQNRTFGCRCHTM